MARSLGPRMVLLAALSMLLCGPAAASRALLKQIVITDFGSDGHITPAPPPPAPPGPAYQDLSKDNPNVQLAASYIRLSHDKALRSAAVNVDYVPGVDYGTLALELGSVELAQLVPFSEVSSQGYEDGTILYVLHLSISWSDASDHIGQLTLGFHVAYQPWKPAPGDMVLDEYYEVHPTGAKQV